MAWVTKLGPNADQVTYRLHDDAGCGEPVRSAEADAAMSYRMDHVAEGLMWVGRGLDEFGIAPGTALRGDEDKKRAVGLMAGRDPRTGEKLVAPELRVDPRAKLSAARLVDALDECAEAAGVSVVQLLGGRERLVNRVAQARRGIAKDDEQYVAPVGELEAIADAAGLCLEDLYDAKALAFARQHAAARVDVRNRGYDLTFEVTKSYSVLHALADERLAARLEDIFDQAMNEAIAAADDWCSYGQRGRNTGGKLAERIDTSGLAGWVMKHHTARPVAGAMPDPHLHAHVVLANMARGADGQWGAIASGGRDLHRHARALDGLFKARLRHLSAVALGVEWERDPETGAWEVVGVPRALRDRFSKRHGQVAAQLAAMGIGVAEASRAQSKAAAAATAEPKLSEPVTNAQLRADWRAQTARVGIDAERLAAVAAPGPADREGAPTGPGLLSEKLAKVVFDPDTGLTAHDKRFTHAQALAAVADAAPGLVSAAQLEELTAAVLRVRGKGINHAVPLERAGSQCMSHPGRYTTTDLAAAETTILDATRYRLAEAAAHPASRVEADVTAMAVSVFEAGAGFALSAEQRAVIDRLTTSGNGIEAVIGVAGSGKTTIMQVLRSAHEAAGHTIAGCSTAAVAAHHLEAETGIASGTIASWLNRGSGLTGIDVLVIDEAGMTDDRDLARLVAEAGRSGTQLVGIGDPLQLASPGVGSCFADIHAIVDGTRLTENRRQTEETHRKALVVWRTGKHVDAVRALAEAGTIHTGDTIDDVHAAMIRDWNTKRQQWSDPHDRLKGHLMLAGTNTDVAALNDAAQAIRIADGELDPASGRDHRLPGGRRIRLHPGDQVIVRQNDYARNRVVPLLNGFRGIVTDIDHATGDVTVQWRALGDHGNHLAPPQQVSPDYIRAGGLDLAYALTVHKAQGQTAQHTTVHLTGLDPHGAYPALSRHRGKVDAWIARDVVESDADRLVLGDAGTDAERLRRAVNAYAKTLARREADPLVITELPGYSHLLAHRRDTRAPERAAAPSVPTGPAPMPPWWQRQHGHLTDEALATQLATLPGAIDRAEAGLETWHCRRAERVERRGRREEALANGQGRVSQALIKRRDLERDATRHSDKAAAAKQARQRHQDVVADSHAHLRCLRAEADKPWWKRLRAETSKQELREQIHDLEARIRDEVAARAEQQLATNQHEIEARRLWRESGDIASTTGTQNLRDLDVDWEIKYTAAIDQDKKNLNLTDVETFYDRPPTTRTHINADRDRLAELRTEAELRATRAQASAQAEAADRAEGLSAARSHAENNTRATDEQSPDRATTINDIAAADRAAAEAAASRAAHRARTIRRSHQPEQNQGFER